MITLSLALQLGASVTAITSMWLMGNKSVWGPAVGLASQVLWFSLAFTVPLYGLLPLNVVLTFVHARNLWLWWPRKK